MCGISGFFDPYADYTSDIPLYNSILNEMTFSLKHRGPDALGSILTKRCGFSHTRLSIRDIENGSQPMIKNYSSYGYNIIYNGEIYNTDELKKDLLLRNVTVQTTSDTEILLLSFMEFGPDFIKKVNGIFAFAIYDEMHETLTLFRDCFGIKPLFYTISGNTCIFSSEIKGIFNYPGINACIDREGLCEIFGLGPARNPGSAVFKNIHEILPGTYMTFSKYGYNTVTYYRITSHPHNDSYEETIEKTHFLITNAIKQQMVSDVPICTFLSGGVDSSVVSAICSNELKKHNKQLKTFSFDFVNNETYFKSNSFQPSMDRPFVEKMVSFLNSDHTFLECDNKSQADLLYDSVKAHDLPCMADVDSSLLFFCHEVAKTQKVVLTGECADEIFGGYPWFHKKEFLESRTFPWTPLLEPRKKLLDKGLLNHLHLDEYVQDSYNTAISQIDILPMENKTETSRRRISYLNIRFFMQTLLNRMDRTSMYSGLEARVPFANKDLIDYVFNIPWEMKAKDGVVKNILRQSVKGLLPDEILFRRKSPYPKTYDPEYDNILSERLKKVLKSNSSPILALIDKNSVNNFLCSEKDLKTPWYGQLMAGPQMTAYLLQINYFLKFYNVKLDI